MRQIIMLILLDLLLKTQKSLTCYRLTLHTQITWILSKEKALWCYNEAAVLPIFWRVVPNSWSLPVVSKLDRAKGSDDLWRTAGTVGTYENCYCWLLHYSESVVFTTNPVRSRIVVVSFNDNLFFTSLYRRNKFAKEQPVFNYKVLRQWHYGKIQHYACQKYYVIETRVYNRDVSWLLYQLCIWCLIENHSYNFLEVTSIDN